MAEIENKETETAEKAVLTVRVPPDLANRLDAIGLRRGLTRNPLIVGALWDFVETEEIKYADMQAVAA